MAITAEKLAELHPKPFHMATASWPSIRRHELLGASALPDRFEVRGCERKKIASRHRSKSVTLCHPKHGVAVIRDQKPVSGVAPRKALPDDMKPGDWYKILNSMVFFWPTGKGPKGVLGAYKGERHTILVVRTRNLLEAREDGAFLSPIDSGNTRRKPAHRGRNTFYRIGEEPIEPGRKGNVAELAGKHSVPDPRCRVIRVEERGADGCRRTIRRNPTRP